MADAMVVGAGPVGLMTAVELTRRGVSVIDAPPTAPATTSRARGDPRPRLLFRGDGHHQ